MIKDNTNRLHLWQGTKKAFNALRRYRTGGLYFVMDGQAVQSSEDGVIYLAIGAHQVVRFGSFSREENIDAKIQTIIEEKTEIHVHEWYGDFPDKGEDCNLYIDAESGNVYRWDGNTYVVFGGYEGGQGIRINNGTISLDEEVLRLINESENDLEEFAETVPHLRYMTEEEVDAIFEEVFDEPYITENR